MTPLSTYSLNAHLARAQRIVQLAGERAADRFIENVDRIFSERNVLLFCCVAFVWVFMQVAYLLIGRG